MRCAPRPPVLRAAPFALPPFAPPTCSHLPRPVQVNAVLTSARWQFNLAVSKSAALQQLQQQQAQQQQQQQQQQQPPPPQQAVAECKSVNPMSFDVEVPGGEEVMAYFDVHGW